jgi:hypothetical protein
VDGSEVAEQGSYQRKRIEQMDTEHIASLEQRISRLEHALAKAERRSRRTGPLAWLAGCASLVLLTGALSLATASAAVIPPQSATVRAPFKVVNAKGDVVMLVASNGMLIESGGHPAAQLTANNWGGSLWTFDPTGKANGCVCGMEDGGSQLKVGMAGSGNYVTVGGAANGAVGLRAFKDKKEAAFVGSTDKGGATALYMVGGAAPSTYLGAGPDGGFLQLQQQNGSPMAVLATNARGGYFTLANKQGTDRVDAGVSAADLGIVRVWGTSKFNFLQGG